LGLILRADAFLGPLLAVGAMAAYFFVLRTHGWHHGQFLGTRDPLYLQATTACLSAIVVMQIANLFICRSSLASVFSRRPRNKFIALGLAVEIAIILLIVYTPWGNAIFATAPLPLSVWLFVVPFALGMLALEEVRKLLQRVWSSGRRPGFPEAISETPVKV
jgi:magnesium-transporting ATPase (P-type)